MCDRSSRYGLRTFHAISNWLGEQKNSRLKPKHKAMFLRSNKEEQPEWCFWCSKTEQKCSRGTKCKYLTNLGQTLEFFQCGHGLTGQKLRCGGGGKVSTVASGKSERAELLGCKAEIGSFQKTKRNNQVGVLVFWNSVKVCGAEEARTLLILDRQTLVFFHCRDDEANCVALGDAELPPKQLARTEC